MPTMVQITVESAPDTESVKIFHISGELDESNLPDLEEAVEPYVMDSANKKLIFNFNRLEFMSSKIIGYMASVYNRLNADGREMILAGCNKIITDILSIVGLNQLMPAYPTLEEALKHC